MKIGKFTFQNRKWYYNELQLANPIVIIWNCIWIIPLIITLTIFALTVAIAKLDISEFKRIWCETL